MGGCASRNPLDTVFFHSFTGAVVYGHGTPTNVPKALKPVVAILSDALFMVCTHGLCSEGRGVLLLLCVAAAVVASWLLL